MPEISIAPLECESQQSVRTSFPAPWHMPSPRGWALCCQNNIFRYENTPSGRQPQWSVRLSRIFSVSGQLLRILSEDMLQRFMSSSECCSVSAALIYCLGQALFPLLVIWWFPKTCSRPTKAPAPKPPKSHPRHNSNRKHHSTASLTSALTQVLHLQHPLNPAAAVMVLLYCCLYQETPWSEQLTNSHVRT